MARRKVGSIYTEIRARLGKLEKDYGVAHQKTKKAGKDIQATINKLNFDKAGKSIRNLSDMWLKFTGVLAGAGAIGGLIKIGSDYENSVFQMSKTFQDQSDVMIEKARQLSEDFKHFYNFNDVAYAFTKTADSMQRYGITGEKYINLVTRAADVGAGKNLQLKESIDRIESAMRGEAEASEYLGVTLNDTYMKNIALDGAFNDTWETMSDLEKAQARYNELLVQTEKYQGSAEDATKTLTGALQSLYNAIKDRLNPGLKESAGYIAAMANGLRNAFAVQTDADALIAKIEELNIKISQIERHRNQLKDLGISQNSAVLFGGQPTDDLDRYIKERNRLFLRLERTFKAPETAASVGGGGGPDADARIKAEEAYQKMLYERQLAVRDTWQVIGEMSKKGFEEEEKINTDVIDSWMQKDQMKLDLHSRTLDAMIANEQSASRSMIQLSERTAAAMQQNFSDLFYDAFTGKLDSLQDYFVAFGDSLVRAWSDIMGQMATESLFGSLSKVGGGGGFMSSLAGFFGTLFGGSAGSATTIRGGMGGGYGFQHGGYIGENVVGVGRRSGKSYEFHGNEFVVPEGKMGGDININVAVSGGQGSVSDTELRARGKLMGQAVGMEVRRVLVDELRPGGILARAGR